MKHIPRSFVIYVTAPQKTSQRPGRLAIPNRSAPKALPYCCICYSYDRGVLGHQIEFPLSLNKTDLIDTGKSEACGVYWKIFAHAPFILQGLIGVSSKGYVSQ